MFKNDPHFCAYQMISKAVFARRCTASLLIVAMLSTTIGCSSSSDPAAPEDTGSPIALVPGSGHVDIDGLDPETVHIWSAWDQESPVAADGSFTTTVSDAGAQLMMLMDDQQAIRGMALSLPGEDVVFDAESAALAAIFVTPGLAAIDSTEARERIALIKTSSSFAALRDSFALRLGNTGYSPLITSGGALATMVMDCVLECFEDLEDMRAAKYASRQQNNPANRVMIFASESEGQFSVKEISTTAEEHCLELENWAWRWLRIYRNKDDVLTMHSENLEAMPGIIPFSIGSMYASLVGSSGAVLNTSTKPDSLALCSELDYYFSGPGWDNDHPSEPLPDGVGPDDDFVDAWGLSIVLYLLTPILSMLAGIDLLGTIASSPMGSVGIIDTAVEFYRAVLATGRLGRNAYISWFYATEHDFHGAVSGLLDLVAGVLTALPKSTIANILARPLGTVAAATVAEAIYAIIVVPSAIFGLGNLTISLKEWWKYPRHRKLEVVEGRASYAIVNGGYQVLLDVGTIDVVSAYFYFDNDEMVYRGLDYEWTATGPVTLTPVPGEPDKIQIRGDANGEGVLTCTACGITGSAPINVGGTSFFDDFRLEANESFGYTTPTMTLHQNYRVYIRGTYISNRGSEEFINPPGGALPWQYDASWGHEEGQEWGPAGNYGEVWLQVPGGYASSPPWVPIEGADGFSPTHEYEACIVGEGLPVTFTVGGYHWDDNVGGFDVVITKVDLEHAVERTVPLN